MLALSSRPINIVYSLIQVGSINSDFDIGSYVDLPYLRHYGINKLDYLILSHADADHSGGASSILQKIPVNHLIIADEDKNLYAKILKLPLNNPLLTKAIVARGNTTFNLEDIHFQISSIRVKKKI